MDYKKQIEEIIIASENKEFLNNVNSLADAYAVFFFSLCNKGMKRDEAMDLTRVYLMEVMASSRENQ